MNGAIPTRDDLPVYTDTASGNMYAKWSQTWQNWFNAVSRALVWNLSLSGTVVYDFGSIAAHTEASTTLPVRGVRALNTPTVLVTPSANTAGIVYKGIVTADDTVTIYALNTTAAPIDPASATFRVTVLQP